MEQAKHKVGVLGASGYTGAELLRLLLRHPRVEIAAIVADRNAGRTIGAVFPHLDAFGLPRLSALAAFSPAGLDAVFCALPHGVSQDVVAGLPAASRILDLSADFRLRDPAVYREWYGEAHRLPDRLGDAVYGLAEFARPALREARLVAVPGCYPTGAQLPLIPLIEAGLIDCDDIIIDAKSGVSGAGRGLKESSLFAEASEGVAAYGVGRHRHMPEIEQGLSAAAGRPLRIAFTPHLIPINRGILSTIYVRLAAGATVERARAALAARYADEPFVRVVEPGVELATSHVRGSNHCLIGVFADRLPGRAILVSVIDNLVKGASGQAIQCLNLMFGWPETLSLEQAPLFP